MANDENRKPTVGDLLDDPVRGPKVLERIAEIYHHWDIEQVTRPDLYGPSSKAVWKRLRAWQRNRGKGVLTAE